METLILIPSFIPIPPDHLYRNQIPVIEEQDERYPLLVSVKEEALSIEECGVKRRGISWVSVAFGIANASIGIGLLNYPAIYNRIGSIQDATIIQLVRIR